MPISQITANSIASNTITDTNIGAIANTKITGLVTASQGGTGVATLTANNVIIGNGISSVNFVAPGTSSNVLTSNGTTWTSAAAAAGGTTIPSGTVMLFGQTAAPTGFTKLTNQDNASLRVVSGTASTGGSVDFTTAFASQTPTGSVSITTVSGSAGATTLTTPQIPSHTHTIQVSTADQPAPYNGFVSESIYPGSTVTSNATGGDGSHTHPFSFSSGSGTFSGNAINLAVKYVDVIRATKD